MELTGITLCCDWSFHMPDGYITGSGGISYCNQTLSSPGGWGLGRVQGQLCKAKGTNRRTYALLLVGVAHAFGRSAMCTTDVTVDGATLEEFQKVNEVSNTESLNVRGYGRFSRQPFIASLAAALSYSSISPRTSWGNDYIFALSVS